VLLFKSIPGLETAFLHFYRARLRYPPRRRCEKSRRPSLLLGGDAARTPQRREKNAVFFRGALEFALCVCYY